MSRLTADEERAVAMLERGYRLDRRDRAALLRLIDRRLGINRHPRSWLIYARCHLPLALYERLVLNPPYGTGQTPR
jgi:hypothetical protein